jgi:hypothetical protein
VGLSAGASHHQHLEGTKSAALSARSRWFCVG